ncbi:MAG TPA: FlgB family protein [Paracoccaceae bacterium]|nr:FlgB family protein [Paracoccaceae bacterium]
MFDKPEVLGMASAMAQNASARLSAIARNVANADTPGYRAVDAPSFQDSYRTAGTLPLHTTRAGHFQSYDSLETARVATRPDGAMSPNGNNVSLENEMVTAAGVRRDHDLALTIYKTSLGLLRASLGRR